MDKTEICPRKKKHWKSTSGGTSTCFISQVI